MARGAGTETASGSVMRTAFTLLLLAGCTAAAPLEPPCTAGDPSPWWCVQAGASGPSCGDVRFDPSCVDGAWVCPFSLMPDREHRCICFDGPRPSTQSCTCGDAGLSCTFECGSLRCDLSNEYCAVTASDVGGEPDSYACASRVAPCEGLPCNCIAPGAIECAEEVGAVTARYPGG